VSHENEGAIQIETRRRPEACEQRKNSARDILAAVPKAILGLTALCTGGALLIWAAAPAKRMNKQFMNVGGKKPPGYTHVVKSPPGTMIFISGQGGSGADGSMPAEFGAQARNTFENLKKCLELAGATFQDVVKINYYVTDISNTAELRRIRGNYLNMEQPPASTLVQTGLGQGLLLEIEAIAMIPE
jgi:enamine deaminase RidA (YjgF/YER057c/UK114 family)